MKLNRFKTTLRFEPKYWGIFFLSFISSLIVFAFLVAPQGSEKEPKEVELAQVNEEILVWKKIVLKNEFYPDAWVNLSINWYRLGEDNLARLAIKKAKKLDPVREDIRRVEKQILGR